MSRYIGALISAPLCISGKRYQKSIASKLLPGDENVLIPGEIIFERAPHRLSRFGPLADRLKFTFASLRSGNSKSHEQARRAFHVVRWMPRLVFCKNSTRTAFTVTFRNRCLELQLTTSITSREEPQDDANPHTDG